MNSSIKLDHPLRRALKIRPGEELRVAMMFFYSLAAIGGVIILGRATSRTLFLSLLPETATPYKYILPPLFVVLTMVVYARYAPRYAQPRLIIGTGYLMIAGMLLFRLALDTQYGRSFVLLAALFVYFEVMTSLVGIQFWTFAADMFNPREAKRLFGLIAAGGVLANAIAGAGLRLVANVLLPKDLILVVAASLLGGILCVWVLGQRHMEAAGAEPAGEHSLTLRQELLALRHSPLLMTIGGMMILMSLLTNITDYQLDLSLQRYFAGDGQRMLTFLGGFQFWAGLAAVTFQLFATNRIMEKLGLVAGLLVLPICLVFGSTAFLITSGALWVMALPRGIDVSLRYTVNDAALNILFLPVPGPQRRRARAILDGIVKPPLIGLLGLLFLLFLRDDIDQVGVQATDVVPWSAVALGLLAVWLALVWRARRLYTGALAASLRQRRLDLDESPIDINDETTLQVILSALKDEDALQILHALRLIQDAPTVEWRPHIMPLLAHPSAEVRIMAVRHLGRAVPTPDSAYTDSITDLFDDAVPGVRAAAIEVYCALAGQTAIPHVAPFIEAADLATQQAAIVGLIKHGGLDGMLHAAARLKEMLASPDPAERQVGAQILGQLEVQTFYQPLIPLLQDPARAVQISAIRAAGRVRHLKLIPHLIERLGHPATAEAAVEALVAYGPGIEPLLSDTLSDGNPYEVRIQVPKILRQLGTPAAAHILLHYLDEPEDHIRATVYKALARLQANGVAFAIDRQAMYQAIHREIRHYYTFVVICDDLGETGRGSLLGMTLNERMGYTLDRLFFLFALFYPSHSMALVRRMLNASDSRLRANAIELVDALADREIKELLLPLIEAPPAQLVALATERLGIARCPMAERLAALAQVADPWLRACALFRIGQLGLQQLLPLVETALKAEHSIVRETAVVASRSLAGADHFRQILVEQAANSDFPEVARYAEQLLREVEPNGVIND